MHRIILLLHWIAFRRPILGRLLRLLLLPASRPTRRQRLPTELLYEMLQCQPYAKCREFGALANALPLSVLGGERAERLAKKIQQHVDFEGVHGKARDQFVRCSAKFRNPRVDHRELVFFCSGQWHEQHKRISELSVPNAGWIAVFPTLILFCTRLPSGRAKFFKRHVLQLGTDGAAVSVQIVGRQFNFFRQAQRRNSTYGTTSSNNDGGNPSEGHVQAHCAH